MSSKSKSSFKNKNSSHHHHAQHHYSTANNEETLNFKLPGSMSFSDIQFPVLLKPGSWRGGWRKLTAEHDRRIQHLEKYLNKREGVQKLSSVFLNTESEYIQNEVFGKLLPALENTLETAKKWNAFDEPKCLFNGVDHIAQLLWNNNPRYPKRKQTNLHIFNMPWVQEHLKMNPRPFYPKSWLWTKDYAATIIQRSYRRYLAQKMPEVKELRDFWRKLRIQGSLAEEVSLNPILSKKFAATQFGSRSPTPIKEERIPFDKKGREKSVAAKKMFEKSVTAHKGLDKPVELMKLLSGIAQNITLK